jgi:uncharacterized repeat protein (TIGR02543 family)
MSTERRGHTATLLPDGKVLVAGGIDNTGWRVSSAELYDPVVGDWATSGPMHTARSGHSATLLHNGKVLVAGGWGTYALATSELYDPATGTWAETGNMRYAHNVHAATLLPSGKVLIAGGYGNGYVDTVELYDPDTGTWTDTASMSYGRYAPTTTLLASGKVLAAGGSAGTYVNLHSTELYDPGAGTWTTTASLITARYFHTATLLDDGKVLVAGGQNINGIPISAELFDPVAETWTETSPLVSARYGHTATLLLGGKVLITGGCVYAQGISPNAEVYDPGTSTWEAICPLLCSRQEHSSTLLSSGMVLIVGGFNSGGCLASTELYGTAGICTVTFDADGGAINSTNKQVMCGTAYGQLPVPARAGYTFAGWWTGINGTGLRITEETVVSDTSDLVLYAKWTANTYTVHLDLQGGDGISSVRVVFGTPYTGLRAPSRFDYSFCGWWTEPEGKGVQVTGSTIVDIASDHTLYACWSAHTFNLIYIAGQHGSLVGDCEQTLPVQDVGSPVTAVPDLGYRFVCWEDGLTGNPRQDGVDRGGSVGSYVPVTSHLAIFGNVSFNGNSFTFGEGDGPVVLTVMGVSNTVPYSVTATVISASAQAADYVSPSGGTTTLVWAAGDSGCKTVSVPIKQDNAVEGDEVFYVALGNPKNCILDTPNVFTVQIADDDGGTVPDRGVFVAGIPRPLEGGSVNGGGFSRKGRSVTLVAVPKAGWTFLNWNDGLGDARRKVSGAQAVPNGPCGSLLYTAQFKRTSELLPPQAGNPGQQSAMAGLAFSLPLPVASECLPKVKVSGLPPGLAFSADGCAFSGVPVKAGTYPVTYSVSNPAGSTAPQTFSITVAPLPAWAVGVFGGRTGTSAPGSGSASMSVNAMGAATGKFTFWGTNFVFSAKSYASRSDDGAFTLAATATVGKVAWPLTLAVNHPEITDAAGIVPQTLSKAEGAISVDGQMTLYRNIWKDSDMAASATNYTGYYTAVLPGGSEFGSGYLTFTVDKVGGVKTVGKLADGTSVSLSGTLTMDEAGRVWTVLYTAPAAYKGGGVFGVLEFFKAGEGVTVIVRPLDGELVLWESRNPAATQDYGLGFGRELGLSGGWYDTVGNLYRYYRSGVLQACADAAAPAPEIWVGTNRYGSVCWDLDGLVVTALTNKFGGMTGLAAPKAGTPVKVGVAYDYEQTTNAVGLTVGLTRATGVLKGSFKAWFDYAAVHTAKTINYEGVLMPERENKDSGIEGRGFFLWPDTAKHLNPQGKPVPYGFSWSYDFKILLSESLREGMVLIPGGTNAGTDPDFGAYALTVEPFYMDATEVTKTKWDEVRAWGLNNGYTEDMSAGAGKAAGHPVQTVNWYDCVKWCNARSERNGRTPVYYSDAALTQVYKTGKPSVSYVKVSANGFRLPTATEWEYAARGGLSGMRFPWSDGDTIQHARANYISQSSYSYDTSPTRGYHPVYTDGSTPCTSPTGSFSPNGYGLYDMAGNVSEWCYDWYPGRGESDRVVCGGCWDRLADFCRVANRDCFFAGMNFNFIGFRAVLPVGQQ